MATTNLDYFIAQAQRRKEEREESERQAERQRRTDAALQRRAQLDREMRRALPADLLESLDGWFQDQDVYPQAYYLFNVRGVVLHLWYAEQRNAREWHISRPGTKGERNTCGCVIPEQEYGDQQEFVDKVLVGIANLANYAGEAL